MWKTYSGNWSTFVLVCTMSLSWITQLYVFQLSPDQPVHDMTLPRLLTSFFLSASFWTWTPESWHTSDPVWDPQTQTKSLQLQHCSRVVYWFFATVLLTLLLGGQFMTFPSLNNCGFNSAHSHWTNWPLSSIDQYFTLWPLWTRRGEGKISICQQWKRKTLLVPLPAAQTQLSLGIRDASARVGLVSFWAPILDYIWNNSPEPWALIQDATRQLWECEERAKSRTLTIEGARQGGV